MIKKLGPTEIRKECGAFDNIIIERELASEKEVQEKINELVDAVNKLETMAKNTNTVLKSLVEENNVHEEQIDELQMKLEPEKCETPDEFAEQRKWVGYLCWFWDFKRVNAVIGVLTDFEIDEPHFRKDGLVWYEHCEPVKPDNDIIYKGGDNE